MPETMPVADAMEEAQAVLEGAADFRCDTCVWFGPEPTRDADGVTHCPMCGSTAIVEPEPQAVPSVPVQVPLFEPPPFDFEQAYDELHRLDLRAKNRKAAWESLKSASRDAKEDYDSAINDLHDKFDEIDSARRVAAAVRQAPPSTMGATEGGDAQVGEPTEIEQPQPEEEPTPEPDAPAD